LDFPERESDIDRDKILNNSVDDFHNSRENNYTLLQNAQETLKGAMQMANLSPNPRAFEVVTQLIKTISELNNDLMQRNKTYNDIKSPGQQAESITNVQNNYSMTPTELLEMIENNA